MSNDWPLPPAEVLSLPTPSFRIRTCQIPILLFPGTGGDGTYRFAIPAIPVRQHCRPARWCMLGSNV